jgi:NAD(P)-dependent dehydrogenase (short-subunit alcohol dehydrogenase family)
LSGLADRVALVTGGAISIGRQFVRALAAEGAHVVIADIEDGAGTVAEVEAEFGVSAMSRVVDVSAESEVRELVAETMQRFGRIDVLVNNAALFASMPLSPHTGIEVELWDRVMAVNVRGPFLMAKHVSPHMIAAGYGKIINIGSGTANKGMPDMLAYVTSKAAILGLTRSLARELGVHGICVNTLAPGLIESDSVRANPHHLQFSERVIASRSLPRPGMPDDLLGALVFLAGPASDFVTGQTLAVDGGSINT